MSALLPDGDPAERFTCAASMRDEAARVSMGCRVIEMERGEVGEIIIGLSNEVALRLSNRGGGFLNTSPPPAGSARGRFAGGAISSDWSDWIDDLRLRGGARRPP